jgi:hypothetical protein
MSSHPNPIGLLARSAWWPSAATCAFLASGEEIFSFVLYLLQRNKAIGFAGYTLSLGVTYLVFSLLILVVLGVTVKATALWAVGRHRQAVAPVSARLGQWAVAVYVLSLPLAVGMPTLVLIIPITLGVGVLPAAVSKWACQVALIPLTVAIGSLGWATHGGTSRSQRWASGGMLAVATFDVFSVTWRLSGLPTGEGWLWVGSLDAVLIAVTWAAVGVWLRSTTTVFRAGKFPE